MMSLLNQRFLRHYLQGFDASRLMLLFTAVLLWIGIGLTGFAEAHWLLYIPASLFTLRSITGICPGKLLKKGEDKLKE